MTDLHALLREARGSVEREALDYPTAVRRNAARALLARIDAALAEPQEPVA